MEKETTTLRSNERREQPRRARRRPVSLAAAPSLDALAIEDQFVAEYRAGREPRLAEYVARFPAHAAELLAFATEFMAGLPADALDAARGGARAPLPGDDASLSPGTRRALDVIFSTPVPLPMRVRNESDAHGDQVSAPHASEPPIARVAESSAPYRAADDDLPSR